MQILVKCSYFKSKYHDSNFLALYSFQWSKLQKMAPPGGQLITEWS